MSQSKAFAFGALKSACGFFIAGIAIGAVVWGGHAVWQSRENAKHAPLAEPKIWPPVRIEMLENAQFKLLTMWRDGRLYFQFSADGYPRALAAARDGKQGTSMVNPQITILFLDRNRFRMFEHAIPLSAMTKEVDSQGRAAGLSANSDTSMDPELYGQAAFWDFTWNFPTAAPEPPPPSPKLGTPVVSGKAPKPKWGDPSLWKALKRGMSKNEVRRILGEPSRMEEKSVITYWRYGGYPVGGSVVFDSKGKVSSWSEP